MTRKYTRRTDVETETEGETVTGSDNTEDTTAYATEDTTEAAETPEGNPSRMAGREATDEDRAPAEDTEES